MRASLQFPLESWGLVLPKDLVDLTKGLEKDDLKRWTLVRSSYWPAEIRAIRDKFWTAMKEGKDTRDLTTYLSPLEMGNLYAKVAEGPSILACVLSVDLTPADTLSDFFQQIMVSMEEILRLDNVWHGEPDNKLIASKTKILSTSKNLTSAMTDLVQKAPQLLGGEAPREAIPHMEPGDSDDELEGIMANPQDVENIKEKDLQKNLEKPDNVIEGVLS